MCISLLEVCGDGRKMVGVTSFYNVNTNTIEYSRHIFYRDRSLAESVAAPQREEFQRKKLAAIEKLKELELDSTDNAPAFSRKQATSKPKIIEK